MVEKSINSNFIPQENNDFFTEMHGTLREKFPESKRRERAEYYLEKSIQGIQGDEKEKFLSMYTGLVRGKKVIYSFLLPWEQCKNV